MQDWKYPETQVTIPLIESDLGLLLLSVAEGKLGEFDLKISGNHAATVVLASEGYPHNPAKGGRYWVLKVPGSIRGQSSTMQEQKCRTAG